MASTTAVEKRLLQQSGAARGLLFGAVAAGFLASALLAAQAWWLSGVVDRVFIQGQTLHDVWPLLALMAAMLIFRAACIWLGDVLAQRAASRIKGALRQQLTGQIFALGPAYTRGERSGELVNVLVEGVESLDELITQYLPARYLAGIVPVFVFLVIFVLDPWTTLVLLFAGPMLILLLALIGGQAKKITARRFLELSWMSAFFLDVLQGLTTLKLFGRSKEQAVTIEEISRHYGKTTMAVLATAFQTSLVMEWAATAATAMVALEISLRLMQGALQFQVALTLLLLTPEFFLPLRQFALKYHAGATGKAAAQRIFAILDTQPTQQVATVHARGLETSDNSVPTLPQSISADLSFQPGIDSKADLHFDDVSFAYDHGQRPALQGFSLIIPHGQTVALVGPTGAGKSTVANLLLRFLDPDSGVITVGGTPLAALDRAAWRSQVAWVPQLPHLFHGTIADNIRLARPDADMDSVIDAAQAAGAHAFIAALPQRYDTQLGEDGARLSGGQRQRLAIARAFLKAAPFLILDEATAHLDVESEQAIQAALTRLLQGRTVLIIAHRLKLAYAADQVAVLEHGRTVEVDAPHILLARGGRYQQLVATYEGTTLTPDMGIHYG